MSEVKFTKGPWFIHDALGYAVAVVGKTRIAANVPPEQDVMPDVNLIKAAPSIYEALELVLDALKMENPIGWEETIAQAEDALKLAKGE